MERVLPLCAGHSCGVLMTGELAFAARILVLLCFTNGTIVSCGKDDDTCNRGLTI